MKHRSIEAFVRYSIGTSSDPNFVDLQPLLDKMTTDELQRFWLHYAASKSLSSASRAVPHWKTKEEGEYFLHAFSDLLFHPKEKDVSGKYIIVRKDLEAHITTKLADYIRFERQLRKIRRSRPAIDKVHSALAVSTLVLVIPFLVCSILSLNNIFPTIANGVIILFYVVLATCLIFFPLLRWLIRR